MTTSVPILETARLRLRPLDAADVEEWARVLYADPEVTRYLPASNVTPLERTERFLRYFQEHWVTRGFGEWAVTDKATGAFMGQCGLNYIEDLDDVEVDFALGKPFWGSGIATEAARTCVRYGFEHAGLARIIGLVVPENIGSRRVLAHLGFVEERAAQFWGLDLIFHAVTPEQFRAAGN
jgi:ribosomal-protein-alanine N-acetyltransferase